MRRAALLFYRKLCRDLEDMGFKVRPYDPCAANWDLDRSQCTVVWDEDDLKMSHKDKAVTSYFAQELGRRNRDKPKIKRIKAFDYLEIRIDFKSCQSTLIISKYD